MMLRDRFKPFLEILHQVKDGGNYPYFRTIDKSWGTEVESRGRRLVMAGSNDYLGLCHDPRVKEASAEAALHWGTGTGGSRFLCGNLSLHEMLEERLADLVGKKKAVVHATGFMTNMGSITSLLTGEDIILCDRENHASIFEGCRATGGRIIPFAHNDPADAALKLRRARRKNPKGCVVLFTEGVYSMSGDLTTLPGLVELKKEHPDIIIYLDDAHGLGVMGPGGRGTAAHFGMDEKVDLIMGTFSKALASVGGFLAGDDEDLLDYVRHQSKPLIFSAALPAANCATVLACLDVLEQEPERVSRLREISQRVRRGYRNIGLYVRESPTPVIPIYIGQDDKAYAFSHELFNSGVFALPAVFPAVPRGQAVVRTAFMSTHQDRQIDFVLEVVDRLARKFGIRLPELAQDGSLPAGYEVDAAGLPQVVMA
jgi:glycine C-acetyltransferase